MSNIRRILCPIDFSEESTHAIQEAIAVARWCKAQITALHVFTPIFMPGLPMPDERVPDAEVQRLHDQMATCFRDAAAAGVAVDVVIEVGQPARHILDRAVSLPADMIVMGTHGAGGFEHLVLGSVTEKVLRKATCAVLTVPPHVRATPRLPFQRVLCAVDFSGPSLAAASFARSLAQESGAALTLLHVIEWPWEEPPPPVLSELPPEQAAALAEYRRQVEKSATARLEALAPARSPDRVAPATRLSHGRPYVEILRVAAEDRSDLILMGVHGRNALDLMVFGSTTNQVVRRATCPVLTLRQ
jgi:nucleotide-binding universal stress UspA family protein